MQVGALMLLVTGLSALPVGYLGDRIGKKPVFAAGLLIVGVMALLAANAVSIPQLMVYVLILGDRQLRRHRPALPVPHRPCPGQPRG